VKLVEKQWPGALLLECRRLFILKFEGVLSDDCIISFLTDVNVDKQAQTERTWTELITYKCHKYNRNGA
jgi:hypothetical protein